MKKILNTIWVMGVLTLAVFCLSACDRDLDVQQSYPFTVETMPVQKDIIRGQTAEIRCTLKRGGEFADTRYTMRYFQSDGKGLLKNDNGTVFKPNDRYPLTDVQQSYPFTVETMPVQKDIIRGQTAEIRCTLKRGGEFADTRYTMRYFQSDGKGLLKNDNGTVFKPNDRYPLTKDVFRLYYTSLSADRQTIDVYVEDSFGKVQQLTFSFNNEREEGKDKPASSRH